jgi:hypothetical protein
MQPSPICTIKTMQRTEEMQGNSLISNAKRGDFMPVENNKIFNPEWAKPIRPWL